MLTVVDSLIPPPARRALAPASSLPVVGRCTGGGLNEHQAAVADERRCSNRATRSDRDRRSRLSGKALDDDADRALVTKAPEPVGVASGLLLNRLRRANICETAGHMRVAVLDDYHRVFGADPAIQRLRRRVPVDVYTDKLPLQRLRGYASAVNPRGARTSQGTLTWRTRSTRWVTKVPSWISSSSSGKE